MLALTSIPPLTWILVPLLGGVIGYVTNRIAVRMVFRPIEPVSILGIRFQGLIGRRQPEMAESIGRVVGDHLVLHDDIIAGFEKVDLRALVSGALDSRLAPKLEPLRKLPLIGAMINDERIEQLKNAVIDGLVDDREAIYEQLEKAVEEGIDIAELVREKVAAFPVERLEALVLQVGSRELRAIEVWGGVLGVLIGLLQVVVISLV
jgi:uncharacterized membrane protein YheB (UPF0754 family)